MLRLALVLLVFATAVPAQATTASRPATSRPSPAQLTAFREQLDSLIRPILEAELSVGLVVGIHRGGTTIVRGYGRVRKDVDRKPDGNTIYEIGSISKVFTGILLGDAISRKLVKLDDPVANHLPKTVTVPRFANKDNNTLRLLHLATHTSGIPSMPLGYRSGNRENPYAGYSADRLLKDLPAVKLPYSPGRTYAYSNFAMGLLGHLMVTSNGKKHYDEVLAERLTGPLGLSSTKVLLDDSMKKRLAPGYTSGGQPRVNWNIGVLAGAGGIRSSVHEMVQFAVANLNPDKTPLEQAIRLAQQKHFVSKNLGQQRRPTVGLAWHHGRRDGVLAHSGATGGYKAFLAIHTGQKVAVTVLANTNSMKVGELGNKTFALALGQRPPPIRVRKSIPVKAAILDTYVGKYRLTPAHVITVTREAGSLFAQLSNQPTWRVFAASETRFFYRIVPAEISFQLAKDGTVTSLTLHQNGRNRIAKRMD